MAARRGAPVVEVPPGGGRDTSGERQAAMAPVGLRLRLSGKSASGNAEHVVLVGATQTGKSTAAYNLVRKLGNLVVIDAARKGQFDHLGVVSQDADAILRHPVVIWQPPLGAITNPRKDFTDEWSRGLHYINTVRAQSGVTVLHDEPKRTLPSQPHPFAAEMVFLGAGRGISVIACTQGLSRIYPDMLDAATHWFMFRLANASQRGTLAASLEIDPPPIGALPDHQFYHWRKGSMQPSGPHPLELLGPRPPV